MKEQKKLDEATLGFEPASQPPPAKESAAFNHWAMQPLSQQQLEINSVEVSFSTFHTVEPYGAVFIMNSNIHLRRQLKRVFQNHFALSPCLFELYIGRSINGLVFFFAAFAEVQVTVLSVLNLPRQGFPATCPIGHCCVCSPRLFASELFSDFPRYNKQGMNKMSTSRCTCCLETQNAR